MRVLAKEKRMVGRNRIDEMRQLIAGLERIAADYEMFQRLISLPTMDEVAGAYLTLLKEAAAS